jgi:hypothetical protein
MLCILLVYDTTSGCYAARLVEVHSRHLLKTIDLQNSMHYRCPQVDRQSIEDSVTRFKAAVHCYKARSEW